MTHRRGHNGPSDEGASGGSEDASFWWLDEEARSSSRPSDVRLRLDRLRHDIHQAPDLSAKILGQAGRHDVFVPRGRRRAIRAMRWGGAAAAALLLGISLWTIYRTPAGDVLMAQQPTPVTDLVADIQDDAEVFANNVRDLPMRFVENNRIALFTNNSASSDTSDAPIITITQVSSNGAGEPMQAFSPVESVSWATGTSVVRRVRSTELAEPIAPMGRTNLVFAFDGLAEALLLLDERIAMWEASPANQPFDAQPTYRYEIRPARAGFFAGEPDQR